ncbi:MAG: hypothetical protein ABI645_00445 [Pseudomonadota bacterium]
MTAATIPYWVSVCTALLTPLIAVVAVGIALEQWRTNRNKLKLDLFDRRHGYYEAARELIASIKTSGAASNASNLEFLQKSRGAQFVVGGNIAMYFEQLYAKALDLNCLAAELVGFGAGPERTTNVGKQSEIKGWFGSQYAVLDEMFKPLLKLEH